MINESRLLNEANSYFLDKQYDKALFIYSQLSSLFPQKKEYEVYAVFCDIASEDEVKALSLYDYFSVAVNEDVQAAIAYVENLIKAYDGDVNKMMNILKDITDSTVDSLDAIKYEDFKSLYNQEVLLELLLKILCFLQKLQLNQKKIFLILYQI